MGVAPGSLLGTPTYDSAKVESWLAPYVGRTPDGPEWIGTYAEVDGKSVLGMRSPADAIADGDVDQVRDLLIRSLLGDWQ